MEEKRTKISSCLWPFFGRKFSSSALFSASNRQAVGFTLVELLLVVAILGILATGFIIIINPPEQLKNSRDARRKSDLRQIQSALELYRADCGRYPIAPPNQLPSPFTGTCTGPVVTYMQSVPKDPKGNNYYYQNIGSSGYEVSICAENAKAGQEGAKPHAVCGFVFFVNNP